MEPILVILLALIIGVFIYIMRQKEGYPKDIVDPYLLSDSNFVRNLAGECLDPRAETWTGPSDGRYLGHALFAGPREAQTSIDYTTPPGVTYNLYYSLCFQLGKWEYVVQRADEWIEVSPSHAQYYQLTHKQKEELEAKIKSGLASAAQAVADLELLKHDERKYREFLNYMGVQYKDGKFEQVGKTDEHSLKAVFIDQVDVHTGDGISMRSIVSRWPTLITDFLKLKDDDMDPDSIKKKLDVSKAEAVVLVTKNKLYQQWKELFVPEIKARYERIITLVRSREKSVEEYREWLKPVIARHKMIEEALLRPAQRQSLRTSFMTPSGHSVATSNIVLWAWRFSSPLEIQKGGTERQAIEWAEKKLDPADEWTMKNLIFHPKHGLVVKYPWITKEWVEKKKKEILAESKGAKNPWLIPHKLYYAFHIISFTKSNIKNAAGNELEDGVFDVNLIYMSQNAVFVKILELMAKKEELNRYIDGLIGIGPVVTETKEKEEKEGIRERISSNLEKITSYFNIPMTFIKRGPYERDWDERITKIMLASASAYRYSPIVEFIKKKMGIGVS